MQQQIIALKVLLIFLIVSISGAKCPEKCRCSLDDRGRKKVTCQKGGMRETIPTIDMSEDTLILIVRAPATIPNHLSLGPIFKGLRRLEEIHIISSSVPNIGAHSFWGLKDLKVLNLTHNSLSTLMDTNFKGISGLKHLDLSYNLIESVPSAVFRDVKHLHSLSLAHNRISNLVTRIFFGLTRLEHLDLSFNPLGELKPEIFSDVPSLKKLSCAACKLQIVGNSILEMISDIKDLDLRDNNLVRIPDGIPLLTNLMSIKLNGNHISRIDSNTFDDSPVSHVHLSHNDIALIEQSAFSNSSISHLDLSYNRLSDLTSGGFPEVLSTLRELKLSGNPLQTELFFNLLNEANQLHHLSLGDIGLSEVPKVVGRGHSLHSLNFSANFITVLPHELFASSPNLRILDISHNQFEGIGEDVLKALTAAKDLRILRLEGNPWQCDQCHVAPLLRWLQKSPDQESGCEEPKVWTCMLCVGPEEVMHQPLALLPQGDLPKCLVPSTKASLSLSDPSTNSILGGDGGSGDTRYLTDEDGRRGDAGGDRIGGDRGRGRDDDAGQLQQEFVDELKVGPSLSEQPVYTSKGILDHNAFPVQPPAQHDSAYVFRANVITVCIGIFTFLIIIVCVVASAVVVYKNKTKLYNICDRDGGKRCKFFWNQDQGSGHKGQGSGLKGQGCSLKGHDKELETALNEKNKCSNDNKKKYESKPEMRTQQMTELKLDETVVTMSESRCHSNVIRETELI